MTMMMILVILNSGRKETLLMVETRKARSLLQETKFLWPQASSIIITLACTTTLQMKIAMRIRKMKVG